VRQRNAGAHPLTVMADPPFTAAPGEVIDFDTPLAGFEPADDDSAPEDSSGEAKPAKDRKSKAAASAGNAEEVTR
jgi:hypothetical protein